MKKIHKRILSIFLILLVTIFFVGCRFSDKKEWVIGIADFENATILEISYDGEVFAAMADHEIFPETISAEQILVWEYFEQNEQENSAILIDENTFDLSKLTDPISCEVQVKNAKTLEIFPKENVDRAGVYLIMVAKSATTDGRIAQGSYMERDSIESFYEEEDESVSGVYADYTSATFEDGTLYLDLYAKGVFGDEPVVSVQGGDNVQLISSDVATGNRSAKIMLSTAADTLNDAMQALDGTVLGYEDSTLSTPVTSVLHTSQAKLHAQLDYIDGENGEYSAILVLSAQDGNLSDLDSSDITITLNDITADIQNVEQTDEGIEVSCLIKGSQDLLSNSLTGTVALSFNPLTNLWGTPSSEETICTFYVPKAGDRAESTDIFDKILSLWNAHGETIKSAASGASTALSVGKTILEFSGVIESTNARIDKVYDTCVKIQADVTNILSVVNRMEDKVNLAITDGKNAAYHSQYNQASAAWNNFYNGSYQLLRNKIDNYKKSIDNQILTYLNGDDHSITLYMDKNGEVTVPKSAGDSKSYKNISIIQTEAYDLTEEQLAIVMERSNNGTKIYDNILNDFKDVLQKAYGEETGQNIYNCFQMQLNYNAVIQNKVSGADDAFRNTCEELLGVSGAKSPLLYYDEMLSLVYNFDSETTQQKETMRAALMSVLIQGYTLATVERSYVSPYTELDDLSNYYDQTGDYIKNNPGTVAVSDGEQYAFVAGKKLKVGYATMDLQVQDMIYNKFLFASYGTPGVGQNGDSKDVSPDKTSIAGMALTKESILNAFDLRVMCARAAANNTDLQQEMIMAGYDEDIVNKSKYLVTSAATHDYIQNQTLTVKVLDTRIKGTPPGSFITVDTHVSNGIFADYTNLVTGEQHDRSMIFLSVLAEYTWGLSVWGLDGKDSTFTVLKFY